MSEVLVASSTAGGAENNGDECTAAADGFERMDGW